MNKVKNKGKSLEELLEEALIPVEEQPYEVPGNWVWVKLGNIVTIGPSKPKLNYLDNESTSFVSMSAVSPEKGEITAIEQREFGKVKKGYTYFEEGDILFAKITPCMENGNTAIAQNLLNDFGFGSTEFFVLRSSEQINRKFLYYLLRSENFRKKAKSVMSGAVGQQRVPKSFLENYPFMLPPLAEQERIANKIESLFAKIDEAKQLIDEAKESFELRRAAILDKAFRGELTQDWHQKHANLESDSQQKLNDIAPLQWKLVDIESIAKKEKYSMAIGPFGSNLKVTDYRSSGVPLVFVRNIRSFNYDLEQKFVSTEKAKTLLPHSIEPNDILITKMGDPPGDADIYPAGLPKAIITSDCIKLKVDKELIINEFALYAIQSPFFQKQVREKSKGVAQQKISLDSFKKMKIYLPPISEQLEVVKLLRNSFESMQQENDLLQQTSERMNALKQSILQKAFRGELDTNDPTEESAIELLKENLKKQLN
ncbi:restriction endonuclease subunit S [Saccharibacillus alkalitolerans]|uniref:Restriction endonuclease subunit S n=1 Tax=Saccharibacillus alkalitolerans TaxID=2705290 RepID=A0ABX0F0V6_9BACL|nr:restriction endonuclease subunit S [Saccharibacillus alkalitolerans]NGZ74095.1 restriction endonuclease subunit S [Saccharibacillus alkalitolerans]